MQLYKTFSPEQNFHSMGFFNLYQMKTIHYKNQIQSNIPLSKLYLELSINLSSNKHPIIINLYDDRDSDLTSQDVC